MKAFLTSPKFISIAVAIIALVGIPLTLIQVQNQQNYKQNAESIFWLTSQSAKSSCATDGSGAIIFATFTNTEIRRTSTEMNVVAKDKQTGKSVNLGSIKGGETKTGTIHTGKTSLQSGSITFSLSWTDRHRGTDSRTANYSAINNCLAQPTPTPSPTVPPGQPTPTICPTLGPVKNVHIDCPNCQISPSPVQ